MKYLPSLIVSFIMLGIWSCTDSGDLVNPNICSAVIDECGVCDGPGKPDGWSSCFFEEPMDYASHIQPIFTANCISCHAGATPSANLTLTSYNSLMDESSVIDAGNYSNSLLWQYINNGFMPSGGDPLLTAQIDSVAAWISEGALEYPAPAQ